MDAGGAAAMKKWPVLCELDRHNFLFDVKIIINSSTTFVHLRLGIDDQNE